MRSERGVVWPYLLLSVALLGAMGFGWYQTNQKNQLALDAENKYMSAFHKLKWTSENIEERSARLMATNDRQLQESLLADLRVYSAQAVEHMSVLPFITMETPRITHFLNTLRTKTDEYHYKLASGGFLTEEEWAQLMELRQQAVFFEDELSEVLGLVGNGMVPWRDTVRATSPAQNAQKETPITQSVLHLEAHLKAPPGEEKAMDPNAGPMARPRTDPGPRVDEATARAAVTRWLPTPLEGELVMTGLSDPEDRLGEFSLYYFQGKKASTDLVLNFGVSLHGGHVIYALDGRPVKEKNLTEKDLVPRAREWLKRWGYPEVRFLSAAENAGTLIMDFAPIKNGVTVHVDRIKVMAAMDNGELVGFDARSYWTNRHERNLGQPKLSAAEALQRLSPRLTVETEPYLGVVADRMGQERLVWTVRGRIDKQLYEVYVDAQSGQEVNILRLMGDPAPPLNEGQ